jgi:thiol-disulfide isomerase/thioredoxin
MQSITTGPSRKAMMVAGVLLACVWLMQAGTAAAGVVQAPDFNIVTLTGDRLTKDSLQGRPALLIFWAPWCRFCQKELPVLSRFVKAEKPAALRVLSIGFADSQSNIAGYVATHADAFAFPTSYDRDNEMARAYRVTATPTTVLVNERGEVVLVHWGAGLFQNVEFREFLSGLKR